MEYKATNANAWRSSELKTQSQELKDALTLWQGNDKCMDHALETMLNLGMDVSLSVATIWKGLEKAPCLPVGTILWRAIELNDAVVCDTDKWMPTSASLQGAEAWANGRKVVICKLIVSDDYVRAIAVGSDEYYENEKEILVAPSVTITEKDTPNEQTPIGNMVKLYTVTGSGGQ